MTQSRPKTNGRRPRILLFRRGHRWIGATLVVFVLYLALSGIALNHATDLGLDRRFVQWPWLLDAYGIHAPEPAASFADGGHHAILLGERLFVDGSDVGREVTALSGLVVLDPLLLATTARGAQLLTTDGEFVEAIDLGTDLPGPVERLGRVGDRAVIESAGLLYRSDADVTRFEPWDGTTDSAIHWSDAAPPAPADLAAAQAAYRGRGVTVERVLLDLHSGRILSMPGTVLMDLVAVFMMVLSISGLILSRVNGRRENGTDRRNGRLR